MHFAPVKNSLFGLKVTYSPRLMIFLFLFYFCNTHELGSPLAKSSKYEAIREVHRYYKVYCRS